MSAAMRAEDDSVLFGDIFRIKTYDLQRRVEEDSRAFLLSPVRPINHSEDRTRDESSLVHFPHSPLSPSPSPQYTHKNHMMQLLEELSKAPQLGVGMRHGSGDRFFNKEPYGPESGLPPPPASLYDDAWLYGLNLIVVIADARRGKKGTKDRRQRSVSSSEQMKRDGDGEKEGERGDGAEATKGWRVPPPADPTCPTLRYIASIANERYELHQYDALFNPTAVRLLEWGARKQQRSKSHVERERQREEAIRARKAQMHRASRHAATHNTRDRDTKPHQDTHNHNSNHRQHHRHHHEQHKPSWDGRIKSGNRLFSEFLPETVEEPHHVSVYEPAEEVEAKHCTFHPTIRNPNEGRERRKPEAFYSGGLEWKKHCDKKLDKKKERADADAKEKEEIDFSPWKMNAYSEKLLVRKFKRESKGKEKSAVEPTREQQHQQPSSDAKIDSQTTTKNPPNVNAATLAFFTSTKSHNITRNYPPFLERTMDDISWRRERMAERDAIRKKLEVHCNRSPELTVYVPADKKDAEEHVVTTKHDSKRLEHGATPTDRTTTTKGKTNSATGEPSSDPHSKSNRKSSEKNSHDFVSPPTTPLQAPSKAPQMPPTNAFGEKFAMLPAAIEPVRSQKSSVRPNSRNAKGESFATSPTRKSIQVTDTNTQQQEQQHKPRKTRSNSKRSDAPINRTGVMCFSPFVDDHLEESSFSLLSFSISNWSRDEPSVMPNALKHTYAGRGGAEREEAEEADVWVVNRKPRSSRLGGQRGSATRQRSPLTEQERRILEASRNSPHRHYSSEDSMWGESPNRSSGKRRTMSPQALQDFHKRQDLWMCRREQRLSALSREKEANDVSECTHRPTLNNTFNNNASRKHFAMAARRADSSSPEDRFRSAFMAAADGVLQGRGGGGRNLFDPLRAPSPPSPQDLARRGSAGNGNGNVAALKDEIMFSSAAKQTLAWKKQRKQNRLRSLAPSARRASPYYSILNYNDIRELQLRPPKQQQHPQQRLRKQQHEKNHPQPHRTGSNTRAAHPSTSRSSAVSPAANIDPLSIEASPDAEINDWLARSRGRPRLDSPALTTPRSVDPTRATTHAAQPLLGSSASSRRENRSPHPAEPPAPRERLSQELLEGLSEWWVSIVDTNRSTSAVRLAGTTLFPSHMFSDDADTQASPFQCHIARSLAMQVLAQAFGERAVMGKSHANSLTIDAEENEWVSFSEFVNMYRPLVC